MNNDTAHLMARVDPDELGRFLIWVDRRHGKDMASRCRQALAGASWNSAKAFSTLAKIVAEQKAMQSMQQSFGSLRFNS